MKAVFFVLSLVSFSAQAQQTRLVLQNVNVVDVEKGKVLAQQTVVIEGNRIAAVQKAVRVSEADSAIDATGKFLIPGLWDMHIHALTDGRYTWVFPLLIANGITGIREMGHNLKVEEAKRIVQTVLDGKLVGPRLGAATAAILDGPGTKLNVAVPVATEDEGRQWVQKLKQQGIDFIKPYNLLSREVYLAVANECKKQNMPFAGHVPFSMTAREVSDLGQRSIEHHTDVLLSCAANETELRKDLLDSLMRQPAGQLPTIEVRAAAAYDKVKAKGLFAAFIRNGTWLCPTLVLNSRTVQTQAQRDADANLRYIPKPMQARWRTQAALQAERLPKPEDRLLRVRMRKQVTTDVHKQGVNLLAGTDAPNPYAYPGFGLHEELAILVDCGLSPAAALRTATLNAAKFLKQEKELGSVKKGLLADLVLLDANPLDDVNNTKKIFAVIANGRFFTRSNLDSLLLQAETATKAGE